MKINGKVLKPESRKLFYNKFTESPSSIFSTHNNTVNAVRGKVPLDVLLPVVDVIFSLDDFLLIEKFVGKDDKFSRVVNRLKVHLLLKLIINFKN